MPDRASLIAQAYSARSDIAALESPLNAARQAIQVASARRWPTVSLTASYGTGYSSAAGYTFADQINRQLNGSIGLSISMPLFDGGEANRATELAQIAVREAELGVEELRQQVAVDVSRVLLDRAAALESLRASEAEVQAANLALEYTSIRYEAGVATLLEVTQAQASLTAASTGLINARYNLAFQVELLEYYLGG
jgi:outer membrane protein